MANEDLPRDPHLSALHRANGERRPRVPDEVRAAVLRAAHEAVRPAAANDDARKDGSVTKPLGGYRAQSRLAVAAVLVLAMGMGWQLIYTTAPTPDTAVTGEETVTASMDLSAPAADAPSSAKAIDIPAEAAAAPMAPSMDRAMAQSMPREAPPPPPPVAAPVPVVPTAPMVANVAAPAMAEAAAAAAPPAAKSAPAGAVAGASAAEAVADAAPQGRTRAELPTVVPVLVAPPARRYKSPQAWWAEIEALQKTDAAAAAREAAAFKRVYPRWPDDPTPAVPTDNR